MFYLFLSIICSVSVGILFKIIKSKSAVNIFLIAINYLIAALLAFIIFTPDISSFEKLPWKLVLPISVLLPTIFLIVPLAINHSGIIKTDITQRISLLIPIMCSYWIFGEKIGIVKLIAICIGLLSVLFIISKKNKKNTTDKNSIYLLFIFLGYGTIDVLFKKLAIYKTIPYTSVLFFIFCLSFIISIIIAQFYKNKPTFELKNLFFGVLLGAFNFMNIYFYLQAHQYFKETPSTVFAGMNFGVIFLGTLIGKFVFKEKLDKINYIGLLLSIISIALIVYAQYKSI